MKTFSKVLLLVVLFTAGIQAQDAFNKGDKLLSAGISLGGLYGIYGDQNFPPLSVQFQYGIEKNLSVGGLIGYSSSSYDYSYWGGEDWSWDYTYILIGAKGEYHFKELFEDQTKWDPYVGLFLGYNIVSVDAPADYDNYYGYDEGASYFTWGFNAGLRYYVSPKVAIFGELGYGLGILTLGATFKL
ncbi:MAG TPA: outer membrane beta-barrel protein [Ignavibacteriales bacterium]|nr:outer membrane beta-barrel protein [Ignavibacteriales bacterium]